MLAFLTDENFNGDIVAGVRRQCPEIDIVRVQDVGLTRAQDPAILTWAADAGRLLLTHDVTTVTKDAYERVGAGLPMPGVVEVPWLLPIGRAIEEILLLAECSRAASEARMLGWEGKYRMNSAGDFFLSGTLPQNQQLGVKCRTSGSADRRGVQALMPHPAVRLSSVVWPLSGFSRGSWRAAARPVVRTARTTTQR